MKIFYKANVSTCESGVR